MAAFTGYFEATAAADPQTVCTALEAEPNIVSAGAVGDQDESGITTIVAGEVLASPNKVIFKVVTEDAATADWAGAVNDVGDIDDTQTSITYDGGSGTKATVPFVIIVDDERMEVTADSGTVFTVTRGFGGTTAAAHLNDAAIATSILAADASTAASAVGGLQQAAGYPTPA